MGGWRARATAAIPEQGGRDAAVRVAEREEVLRSGGWPQGARTETGRRQAQGSAVVYQVVTEHRRSNLTGAARSGQLGASLTEAG